MKIELTEGCINDSLRVNGIEESELTNDQRKKFCKEIVEKMFEKFYKDDFNNFLLWVVTIYGEYSCSEGTCECCGDIVENYFLEI